MTNEYIAILHYKTIKLTISCIRSIKENQFNGKILLIDNYSNNGSAEKLLQLYKNDGQVEFLLLKQNIGFARANNEAMKYLEKKGARFVILTNNDIIFKKNSINKLFNNIENNEHVIIALPKVYDINDDVLNTVLLKRKSVFNVFIWKCGFIPNIIKKIYWKIKTILHVNTLECRKVTKSLEVENFNACCLACDLEKMKKVNYFDDFTFLYYEEDILVEKIMNNTPYKIIYFPDSKVTHYEGATTKKTLNYFMLGYFMQSESYYLRKYRNVSKSFLILLYSIESRYNYRKYKDENLRKFENNIIKGLKNDVFYRS